MKIKEEVARIEIFSNTLVDYCYTKMSVSCSIWIDLQTGNKNIENGKMKIIIHNNRVHIIEISYERKHNDAKGRTTTQLENHKIYGDSVRYLHLRQEPLKPEEPVLILELVCNAEIEYLIHLLGIKSLFYIDEFEI